MAADRKAGEGEGADAGADELEDAGAQGLHHAADLAVAAFGEGDLEKRVARGVAHTGDHGRKGRAVGKGHARPEAVEGSLVQQRGGFHQVGLRYFILRIGKTLAELGVVGEQEEAGGFEVEPPDREDVIREAAEEVVDSGAVIGVVAGGEVTGGLIEQEIDFFGGAQELTIEGDAVAAERNPVVGILNQVAIDVDPAGVDERAGLRAGNQAEFGENPFERLGRGSYGKTNSKAPMSRRPWEGRASLDWCFIY